MKKLSFKRSKLLSKTLFTVGITGMLFFSSCSVMLPVAATSNTVGSKTGTSTATSLFGFWITPDAGIKSAAANGGITKVSTVDVKSTNILFIYRTFTTTVSGD